MLRDIVQENQHKGWQDLAQLLFEKMKKEGEHTLYKMRKGKQVRERWLSILDPMINQNKWSAAEEYSFLRHWLRLGNKWKGISEQLSGRCESQCKNRFKLILRREGIKEVASDKELRDVIKRRILKGLKRGRRNGD